MLIFTFLSLMRWLIKKCCRVIDYKLMRSIQTAYVRLKRIIIYKISDSRQKKCFIDTKENKQSFQLYRMSFGTPALSSLILWHREGQLLRWFLSFARLGIPFHNVWFTSKTFPFNIEIRISLKIRLDRSTLLPCSVISPSIFFRLRSSIFP